ncbi:MAG: HEPN domain-containing protein [Oscillospiraceae bacterium]|jgi:HEPN domain-containing protein|nr:HEPN domain-containing protein [Oscillospiraceae bacterium]
MARRRANNYTDSKHYYDWLDRANEDILSAKHLKDYDTCFNNAAFHCQQTIEKALKAYILLKSNELVDGHNLTWLCKRAMRYDREFSKWLDESASLNRCYIETRYPADIPLDLTSDEISRYYNMALEMYRFICAEVDEITEKNAGHPMQRAGDDVHVTKLRDIINPGFDA